jgi:hypothetical protein
VRALVALGLLIAGIVNIVQLARSSTGTSYRRGAIFGGVPSECRTGTRDGLPLVDLGCLNHTRSGFGSGPIEKAPQTTPVVFRSSHDRRVRIGRTFSETVRGLGIAFTLLGVLLGSTFLAAEFGSAGLSTQLLFEPRRGALYLAKVAGVFVGCFACAALLTAWVGVGQYAASAWRGKTTGVDAGWLAERLADTARAGVACGFAGVCALAVGSLARRTVVAVSVFFGLVIATGFLGNVRWGKPLARVSPMNVLFATAFGKFTDHEAFFGLHTIEGVVLLAVIWTAALSLIGAWWFNRREIR